MKRKNLYNYKKALNVPYMVQKLTKKFSLENPIKVTKIAVFALTLLSLFTIFKPLMIMLRVIPGLDLACYALIPISVTMMYDSVEPDGLKIYHYLWDSVSYILQYKLIPKRIYQDNKYRAEVDEKIQFEKMG
ncbi:conjugal transfer protein [Enterococcus mundtii]|uniref:conjugal transfer protein n=1 Tax=Enterococcus mundtii TaxID=53346 RepID=UPI0008249F8C|nr:conjugal transfer protein [Enterococcus mundtii]